LKGLERLILFHLEETNLSSKPLCDAQHAFWRGKGTDTALSEAVDKIESGLLKQQYALAIFLDIKGAFNSITFKAAIGAMSKRGFPKNITGWYNHFLHNQVSTLELDNCRFTRKLETGTPQGGVVSPIVWNVCIDPILKKLNTNKPVKVIGFVDDVVIMVTGCDPSVMVRRAQPSINAMVEWGKESGLEFNTDKTVVVMFTQKKTTIQDYHEKVKVNGQTIEFSSEAKYLGITLDSRLNWNSHL
jgi:hypothetical protein